MSINIINKFKKRFQLTENRGKILKNIYWAVLGKVINIISGLLVGILVARYLGPKSYGLMNYVISYVTLFSIFANFGLDNIEIRELSKLNAKVNIILGTNFIIRLILSIITVLLIIVSLLIFESDSFTFWMIIIYSISLILSSFDVIRTYFTSIILNEYVVKTEISRTIIGALIKVVILFLHLSLEWFIIASAFDFALVSGGYIFSYRKKVGRISDWSFDINVAKYFLKESFPLLLSGTAIIIYQKIDQVMIRNMIDNGALGQFAVASKISEISIFIPAVIAQTLTPILVKAKHKDIDDYKRKRLQFMDIMLWGAVGMSFVMCIAAYPIVRILFGLKYLDAIPVLQIMSWKAIFVALFSATGQIIIIENIQKYAVYRNIFGCFISVAINFLLIPYWGIIGSALATVITMSFTGYFSHLIIPQYRYLFEIQNNSILHGFSRCMGYLRKSKKLE